MLPTAKMVWTEDRWRALDARTRADVLAAGSEAAAWARLVRAARGVMRTYTTSFFIVSRFLPRDKRDRVELIYAGVRWPDEIVDSFPLSAAEKLARLDAWADAFERAWRAPDWRAALRDPAIPAFVGGFARVCRDAAIPPDYYRAFLAAMRRDAAPQNFATLQDLIDNYIYGSAVVVGYFLAHVYGAVRPADFPRALQGARDLGIALQLTNFLRDVGEDWRRGRLYLPVDFLADEELRADRLAPEDPAQGAALGLVVHRLAGVAADYYRRARNNLDAFAADSRLAIAACIDVYGLLNTRILQSDRGIAHRASVPWAEKWRVLPVGKYWRIPAAYLWP